MQQSTIVYLCSNAELGVFTEIFTKFVCPSQNVVVLYLTQWMDWFTVFPHKINCSWNRDIRKHRRARTCCFFHSLLLHKIKHGHKAKMRKTMLQLSWNLTGSSRQETPCCYSSTVESEIKKTKNSVRLICRNKFPSRFSSPSSCKPSWSPSLARYSDSHETCSCPPTTKIGVYGSWVTGLLLTLFTSDVQ